MSLIHRFQREKNKAKAQQTSGITHYRAPCAQCRKTWALPTSSLCMGCTTQRPSNHTVSPIPSNMISNQLDQHSRNTLLFVPETFNVLFYKHGPPPANLVSMPYPNGRRMGKHEVVIAKDYLLEMLEPVYLTTDKLVNGIVHALYTKHRELSTQSYEVLFDYMWIQPVEWVDSEVSLMWQMGYMYHTRFGVAKGVAYEPEWIRHDPEYQLGKTCRHKEILEEDRLNLA
jgi:hypothetical protein